MAVGLPGQESNIRHPLGRKKATVKKDGGDGIDGRLHGPGEGLSATMSIIGGLAECSEDPSRGEWIRKSKNVKVEMDMKKANNRTVLITT